MKLAKSALVVIVIALTATFCGCEGISSDKSKTNDELVVGKNAVTVEDILENDKSSSLDEQQISKQLEGNNEF